MYALDFLPVGSAHAKLLFNDAMVKRFTSLTPSVIDITMRFAPARIQVESFIQDIYRKSYGADIAVTYPTLMSVRNIKGEILAAAGFRLASEEPLFLEQYTEVAIEDVLGSLYSHAVTRKDVAEIGNLASSGNGASVFLYAAIASYLLNQGARYASVTGTDRLQRHFQAMGLNPHILCDAERRKLNSEQKNWGTYYDTQPRVLAGSLESSMCQLNKRLGAVYQENGITLFPRLHKGGCRDASA